MPFSIFISDSQFVDIFSSGGTNDLVPEWRLGWEQTRYSPLLLRSPEKQVKIACVDMDDASRLSYSQFNELITTSHKHCAYQDIRNLTEVVRPFRHIGTSTNLQTRYIQTEDPGFYEWRDTPLLGKKSIFWKHGQLSTRMSLPMYIHTYR